MPAAWPAGLLQACCGSTLFSLLPVQQWFWCTEAPSGAGGGSSASGLNSKVSSRSQLEHGHLWTWRCTEQLWTLAELPSAEWQSMTSCLALCRELITHARRTRWVKICITGVSSEVCVQSAKGDHAATPRTAAPAAREDTGSATAIGARCGASIALVH